MPDPKLTPGQREAIAINPRGKSVSALAREFKVDRRTIQFLLYPERRAANRRLEYDRRRGRSKGGQEPARSSQEPTATGVCPTPTPVCAEV